MPQVPPSDALSRQFDLAETTVEVAGQTYSLLRPRSVDELISEEDFAIDERIPYWADCWPSARVLAEHIAGLAGRGKTLLELGCGIGLVSLAAAQAGFEVLATDYYADALRFTAANAARHGLKAVDTRLVDWRRLPSDLGRFDIVAASDVLYESPQAVLIVETLALALAPGGLALVSDPGRHTAETFVERCQQAGFAAQCVTRVGTADSGAKLTVDVYEVRWK